VKMWGQLRLSTPPLLIPLISLLVFNLGQNESWLQGYQTLMFLGVACVIIGIFTLAENTSWISFFCAIALGVIANYSMVNGLLYWLVGLIVIFMVTSKELRIIRISLWVLFGGLCVGLFLAGWTSGGHLNIAYVFSHILEWFIWILNFLGAPIMTLWYVAWIFGFVSIGLYILVIGYVIRTHQWKPLIPYFAIVLFILLTAFSASLGRMEMGMPQSVVPRYLTMSVWYWVSLLALLPLLKNMSGLYQRILYSLFAVSLIFLMIRGGWGGYTSLYKRMLPSYQTARSGELVSDEVLFHINPDPDRTRLLEFLRENKLSVYAEQR
jgi:hypothetical protein